MTGILETIPNYSLHSSRSLRDALDVTTDSSLISLPLRTLGLPGPVLDWLLDAGISTMPLERATIRQGVVLDQGHRAILLYDSRNASARIDAEAAEALGYEIIDAARLLAGRRCRDEIDRTVVIAAEPRRRFLDGLRTGIEDIGGMWFRLADFPHPYRAAVCAGATDSELARYAADPRLARLVHALAEIPAGGSTGRLATSDFIRACQTIGRPIRIASSIENLRSPSRSGLKIGPLTWRATLRTFVDWWHWRTWLSLSAVRGSRTTELRIAAPKQARPTETWQPAVEIWRGRHCAIVPVQAGANTLHDDAVPFQLQTHRYHAGFLADESDMDTSRDRVASLTAAS